MFTPAIIFPRLHKYKIYETAFCLFVCLFFYLSSNYIFSQNSTLPFRNSDLSIDARVNDLLQRLTTEEKISLLGYQNKPVTRLGIPAYNWWNEGLHGVARAGNATVFRRQLVVLLCSIMNYCFNVLQ